VKEQKGGKGRKIDRRENEDTCETVMLYTTCHGNGIDPRRQATMLNIREEGRREGRRD